MGQGTRENSHVHSGSLGFCAWAFPLGGMVAALGLSSGLFI